MTQASLLTHVTQTIIDRFHPKRIMVFGSHARGETGPDSDLDLFIEMETPRRPPDRAIDVSEAFGLRAWPMDIVVYTPEEVRRLRHVKGTLLSVIEKEGKVLYEQGSVQLRGMAAQGLIAEGLLMAGLPGGFWLHYHQERRDEYPRIASLKTS